MMGKRKSIGNDPLDWIGESVRPTGRPAAPGAGSPAPEPAANALPAASGQLPSSLSPGSAVPRGTLAPAPLGGPETGDIERQLLLVDGMCRDMKARPRVNRTLWAALLVIAVVGLGALLFTEVRRQWTARLRDLEGEVARIERDRGRNERVLESVIVEKEALIREKQGTIGKIEDLHRTLEDELRIARAAARRLEDENHVLIEKALARPENHPEGRPEGHPEGPRAAPGAAEK
jgi:hypothetical protein